MPVSTNKGVKSSGRTRSCVSVARLCAPTCLLIGLSQAARADLVPVHLRAFGHPITTTTPVLSDTGETYIPLDALSSLNIRAHMNSSQDALTAECTDTHRSQEIAIARPRGTMMVALSDIARLSGAIIVRPDTRGAYMHPNPARLGDTVYYLARLTSARLQNGALHITTSFPVPYRVKMLRDVSPPRGFVDVIGAWAGEDFQPAPVPEGEDRAIRIRSGQNSEEIARVVAEVAMGASLRSDGSAAVRTSEITASIVDGPRIQVAQAASTTQPPASIDGGSEEQDPGHASAPPSAADPGPSTYTGPRGSAPTGQQIEIAGAQVQNDVDGTVHLQIGTSGRATSYVRYEQDGRQLVIDISNATLNMSDPNLADQRFPHPLLTAMHITSLPANSGTVRITLDMTRVVGFNVDTQDDHIQLDLRLPRNATGSLADKVIVVDPGHGGSSTGAVGHGGGTTYEKNVTLAISLRLRAALEACGARVIMTRDRDVDVALNARPTLANQVNADLFVNIHNDSNGVPNSATGTSTYYHMRDPNSRALAQCVQHCILNGSPIGNRGVLSDSVMYHSGFAVLRCSRMPAVLVEVGYINNARDRRYLLSESFQDHVAHAVCEGLRQYVEGSQHIARRSGDAHVVSASYHAPPADSQEPADR